MCSSKGICELRIGCERHAKSNPTAVLLFGAVAGLWSASGYPKGKGDSQEGGKPQVVYPLIIRAASARSSGLQLMQQFSFLLHYAIIKTRG